MVTGGHLPERGQFSTARGAPSGIKILQEACVPEKTPTQQNIPRDAYPAAVVTPLLESPAWERVYKPVFLSCSLKPARAAQCSLEIFLFFQAGRGQRHQAEQ